MTIKRPRGDIARQAEKQILEAINNREAELIAAGEEKLGETVGIKRDQIKARWDTQLRVAEDRKLMRQQAAE